MEHFGRLRPPRLSVGAGKAPARAADAAATWALTQAAAERRLLRDATDWLFSANGHDRGQVELTFVGASTPVVKHRRDFLTGAMVDRAVQQAAHDARRAERRGGDARA